MSRGAKRILVVAPEPFYEDRGTPIAVRQVLEALVECGYAVDLLTYPVGAEIELPGVRILRCRRPLPIRSVPIGFSLRKMILDLALVWALRRRLATRSYRAVHAVEEAAFPAVWLARRRGIPVLYDMQSSLPEGLAEVAAFRIPPFPLLFRRLERWLLRNASYVVSSTGLAYRVGTLAPQTGHREWRFPSSPPRATDAEVARLRSELEVPPGARVVVYTGNFEEYQGVHLLIGAIPAVLRAHPNAVFVLVGLRRGSEAHLRGATELWMGAAPRSGPGVRSDAGVWSATPPRVRGDAAAGDSIRAALRLVRRRPREEMPAFYRLADILVSPRTGGSNLPLKVLDYMATGRPILATDVAAHRSVLDEERALLVAPDPDEIAAGILRLLAEPALGTSLARAAAAYAEEHLGWGTFVDALRDIYEESVGGPEARGVVGEDWESSGTPPQEPTSSTSMGAR